jgi:hypothetical protein
LITRLSFDNNVTAGEGIAGDNLEIKTKDMSIIAKRTRIRELKKSGEIPESKAPRGTEIVSMTVEEADAILRQYDKDFGGYTGPSEEEPKEEPKKAPVSTQKEESNPPVSNDLASLIAAAVAPHVQGTVDQAQFDELAKQSEEIAGRLEEMAEKIGSQQARPVEVVKLDGSRVEMGLVHRSFDDLLTVVSCRLNAYLVGPAGSFKTSTAEKVAQALELECSAISVCQQTTAVALLGYMDATGSYVSTEFRKRYEQGGIFILDEIDNGNPNVLAVLNSALANGSCAFPDGMIKKHEDFRLIATANTFGTGANAQYVGRCQLDAATLDRFAFIEWGYDEEMERAIAGNDAWVDRIVSLRRSAEKLKSRIVISPRATFEGAVLLAAGMEQSKVENLKVWKGTSKEERVKIEGGA